MSNASGGGGFLALALAHAACCGALVLVATGAVGGLGAWLLDSGLAWLGAGGIAIAVLLYWRRRRSCRAVSDRPAPRVDAERAQ
jgi:hypothetical protein